MVNSELMRFGELIDSSFTSSFASLSLRPIHASAAESSTLITTTKENDSLTNNNEGTNDESTAITGAVNESFHGFECRPGQRHQYHTQRELEFIMSTKAKIQILIAELVSFCVLVLYH